jgi:hypothetical protein
MFPGSLLRSSVADWPPRFFLAGFLFQLLSDSGSPGAGTVIYRADVLFLRECPSNMRWLFGIQGMGFGTGLIVSDSSEHMLLLLQELALLNDEELNSAARERRREEINLEIKELAKQKRESEAAG